MEKPRPTYEILKELESKGLGHFDSDGEWVHDCSIDPETKKIKLEPKEE